MLILGGGSGSRAINEAVRTNLPALLKRFDILHLCGKSNLIQTTAQGYVQREYENDMASAYACADIVISRAGSNTVFELLALGKPALLIPLEHASRGDQLLNANYFAEKELCCVLHEHELSELPSALLCLYGNAKVRTALATNTIKSGTSSIVALIDELMN